MNRARWFHKHKLSLHACVDAREVGMAAQAADISSSLSVATDCSMLIATIVLISCFAGLAVAKPHLTHYLTC